MIVENILGDVDLQPVIDEISQVVDREARKLLAAGRLSRLYEDEPFETRLGKICRETDEITLSIWNGALSGAAIFNLIRNPKLLDVAERFCGPELIASSVYRLRPKVPHHPQGPVPWHQDSGYFEPYCDNALVLTMWIPLVDATKDNGCLWIIPRAHKQPLMEHYRPADRGYLLIRDQDLPSTSWVCAEMSKGSILLLHNRTPHASFENHTEMVRWSMDLRYQSAGLPTNAPMTRLEGEAGHRADDGAPRACYPPEADFLVRSRKRPGEVVTDPEHFDRLRRNHLFMPVTPRWKQLQAGETPT